MLDPNAQERVEEADGVFGHKLFERDEECGAESEEAVDRGWAAGKTIRIPS